MSTQERALASTELSSMKGKLHQTNLTSFHSRVIGNVNQQEATAKKDVKIGQARENQYLEH